MEYLKSLSRKKVIDSSEDEGSGKLKRALTLLDLTALGVGSTLGLGVYVLAGSVAKLYAGPAVVISFIIAAIASGFAGMCYAEFASRVPKAGSAYIYSYVTVGEFVAFVIGWNLLLEYLLGSAGVARGLSSYIDSLFNYTMRSTLREALPIRVDFLAEYPDFLSFSFLLVLTGIISFGVKESTMLNNLLTVLNLSVIATVIVSGSINADPANWFIPKENITDPEKAGEGGFFPFGFSGVMAGAAKCFFGFVGFDSVATTGEEAKNPRKNIPLSIVLSLIIIFSSYFGISTVLTMMYPYYDQDPEAPFPFVFEKIGWIEIKWIVTVGAIFALCTTMLGAMFPLPRIFYAIGKDGLIFKQLSVVNKRTQTPLIATIVSGMLAGLMAMLFDLNQLIDMMSIATLLAYTIVAMCVLILRYEYEEYPQSDAVADKGKTPPETGLQFLKKVFKTCFNLNMIKRPTVETSMVAKWGVNIFAIFSITLCAIFVFASEPINDGSVWAVAILSFNIVILAVVMLVLSRQPSSSLKLNFKVPCVPLIPCLSIIINIYLMLIMDIGTWVRFCLWLAIGFTIYFFYGHKHSVEARPKPAETKMQSKDSA